MKRRPYYLLFLLVVPLIALAMPWEALATPAVPKYNVVILGCETSLDLAHGMGEVINAFVTISNVGKLDINRVCATLSSNDEDRPHPDKERCVQHLPPRHEVTLKLTIDTAFGTETAAQVGVTTREGVSEVAARSSCREVDLELVGNVSRMLGVVTPMRPWWMP